MPTLHAIIEASKAKQGAAEFKEATNDVVNSASKMSQSTKGMAQEAERAGESIKKAGASASNAKPGFEGLGKSVENAVKFFTGAQFLEGGLKALTAVVHGVRGDTEALAEVLGTLPFGIGGAVKAAQGLVMAFSTSAQEAARVNTLVKEIQKNLPLQIAQTEEQRRVEAAGLPSPTGFDAKAAEQVRIDIEKLQKQIGEIAGQQIGELSRRARLGSSVGGQVRGDESFGEQFSQQTKDAIGLLVQRINQLNDDLARLAPTPEFQAQEQTRRALGAQQAIDAQADEDWKAGLAKIKSYEELVAKAHMDVNEAAIKAWEEGIKSLDEFASQQVRSANANREVDRQAAQDWEDSIRSGDRIDRIRQFEDQIGELEWELANRSEVVRPRSFTTQAIEATSRFSGVAIQFNSQQQALDSIKKNTADTAAGIKQMLEKMRSSQASVLNI